ncbi:MAG: alpha/beta fold hydrolase [Chthonomonadaceae bacterium]|nr:alpha/beta fold hydrolase [Chthonomonadaceae bacterium]
MEERARAPMTETRWTVGVEGEEAPVLIQTPEAPRGTLVFAHGAGGHMEHRHMASLAEVFLELGLEVVRFNFLYRASGRSIPDRMPKLQACFNSVVASVRERLAPKRILLGGHSMGGRCASMMAAEGFACDGLLLCAYPLHPPGQFNKLRDAHLPAIQVPTLCLNGTQDPLCDKELMDAVLPRLDQRFQMHWLEHADHSFHVLKRSGRTDAEVLAEVAGTVEEWLPEGPPDG